jgi:hypothetical protein
MPWPDAAIRNRPYGPAYAIEDLMAVRSWARQRQLRLHVALDQVIEGLEFEEMLILFTPDRRRRVLTLWRTRNCVFAQSADARPQPFFTVHHALEAWRAPAGRRLAWLKRPGSAR